MSRRISASMPWRCSPSRCSPRTTGQLLNFLLCRGSGGDAATDRFRAFADHWRSTVGNSDADMAEMVRRDRIDVLVDLAGHTAGTVCWSSLASPRRCRSTTCSAMAIRPAFRPWTRSWPTRRLPRRARTSCSANDWSVCLACRSPIVRRQACRRRAAARAGNGLVTFGYFGRTVRLNDTVIAAWARMLHAVPASRLVLNSAPLASRRDAN